MEYYTYSLPLQHNFSPPLLVLGCPTAIYTNDKQYTTHIHFHSSIPHTIRKFNVNTNMDNTIAGSIIPRRKLNFLKGRMYLIKTIAHVEQELLTLHEHMNSPPAFSGARVARSNILWLVFYISLFVRPYSIYGFCLAPWCLQTVLTTPTITYYISHHMSS